MDKKPSTSLEQVKLFIDSKAFELSSRNVERESGDIRKCFEILRSALEAKVKALKCSSKEIMQESQDLDSPQSVLLFLLSKIKVTINDI